MMSLQNTHGWTSLCCGERILLSDCKASKRLLCIKYFDGFKVSFPIYLVVSQFIGSVDQLVDFDMIEIWAVNFLTHFMLPISFYNLCKHQKEAWSWSKWLPWLI